MINQFTNLLANGNAPEIVNEHGILNDLFPNVWVLIAHVLVTVVVLFFLIRFVWKPMKKVLGERTAHIQQSINEAERQNEEAKIRERQAEKKIELSVVESAEIIAKSHKTADEITTKAKERAVVLAHKIEAEAEQSIRIEKQKAEAQMKEKVVDLALTAAAKLAEREIARDDAEKVVSTFMRNHK